MQNTDSDKAKEEIDFIVKKLIDFSNKTKYDFELYKSFAYESSKSFNRYFSQIDNETDKEKIISDLKNDFHFEIGDIVSNILGTPNSYIENFEENATYYFSQPETDKRIIGYLDNYKQLIGLFLNTTEKQYVETTMPQQHEAVKQLEAKQQHPKFDPNLWNNDCFELFKYLYDCYYKKTKRQLTNIWFYLKENGNAKYNLKATKEQYEVFILENYQIKITNFDKAQTK